MAVDINLKHINKLTTIYCHWNITRLVYLDLHLCPRRGVWPLPSAQACLSASQALPFPTEVGGYTLDDLKGISPTLFQLKIKLEKDAKPVVDHQRRLNPKMKEVVRKEILKLLEAGIIYPVANSQWVSPIHCVPKKGGSTVVPNDKDELIP